MSGLNDLRVNDSASNAPEEIARLAKKITDRQGCPGILAREASGYHLYIPCPACLETHGRRELDDPKYSINLSMVAGLGDEFSVKDPLWTPEGMHADLNLTKRKEYGSSICMRTRSARNPHRFSMDVLLNMATVTSRFPDILTHAGIKGGAGTAEAQEFWEIDPETGHMAPPPPGEVLTLSSLPEEHPVVRYLTRRGYSIDALERQLSARFCVKEFDGAEKGIFYRRMPGGWKDTPQNRVIFYSMVDGAPLTWQARVIDRLSEDGLDQYMLHPYAGGFVDTSDAVGAIDSCRNVGNACELEATWDPQRLGYWVHGWSHTATRANSKASWIPVPPFDEIKDGQLRFKPSKYRTAKYSSRQMMGWDAAVDRAEQAAEDQPWVVLCEGPLDAARCGPGGVALIGSSISPENAAKVAAMFQMVITAFDNDPVGRAATDKIAKILSSSSMRESVITAVIPMPMTEGKDLGDMRQSDYDAMFQKLRKRSQRML